MISVDNKKQKLEMLLKRVQHNRQRLDVSREAVAQTAGQQAQVSTSLPTTSPGTDSQLLASLRLFFGSLGRRLKSLFR